MYKNSEGYPDPTVGAVIAKMNRENNMKKQKYNRLVYICSPYAGDVVWNTQKAKKYSRLAINRGYVPVAPHLLYPQILNDNNPVERDVGIKCGLALLDCCSEIWVFGAKHSAGMRQEIQAAYEKETMKVRYFDEDGREAKCI